MPYKDPAVRREKQAQYSKSYYEKNKNEIITKSRKRRKTQVIEFAAFKATKSCIKCGESHPATLDFHHVERHPSNRKVHKLVQDGHWWKRIKEEIDKCVVLCANCHRIHHHEERQEIKQKALAKKKKGSNI
jgi:predicted HNH restriction endonuclease